MHFAMKILRMRILKDSRKKKQKVENTATSHKKLAVSITILKDIERKKQNRKMKNLQGFAKNPQFDRNFIR